MWDSCHTSGVYMSAGSGRATGGGWGCRPRLVYGSICQGKGTRQLPPPSIWRDEKLAPGPNGCDTRRPPPHPVCACLLYTRWQAPGQTCARNGVPAKTRVCCERNDLLLASARSNAGGGARFDRTHHTNNTPIRCCSFATTSHSDWASRLLFWHTKEENAASGSM